MNNEVRRRNSNILLEEDLIREYKGKMGMNVSYDKVIYPKEDIGLHSLNKNNLNEREKHIYKILKDDIKDNNLSYIRKIEGNEESLVTDTLYEILTESIEGFVKESDISVLGESTYTKIGIVGTYDTTNGYIFDITTENNSEFVKNIKGNKQKIIKIYSKYFGESIYNIEIGRELKRVQLSFLKKTSSKEINKTFSHSMINVFRQTKSLREDSIYISIGEDSKGNIKTLDLFNEASSIGILGGSGSGKSWKLFDILHSINILNKDKENLEILFLNAKGSSFYKELGRSIEDINKYNEELDKIIKKVKKNKDKKYLIILDEITYVMSTLKNHFPVEYDKLNKQLEDIIKLTNQDNTNVAFIFAGQRAYEISMNQEILKRTRVKISGRVDVLNDYTKFYGKNLDNLSEIGETVTMGKFYTEIKDGDKGYYTTYPIKQTDEELLEYIKSIK